MRYGWKRLILIDTNIFLELLLGQSKAEDCAKLLNRVSKGEIEAVVTRFTIHAVEAVVNNGNLISDFLRNIENSLGLSVYVTSISEETAISILMSKINRDFDDTLQYFVAKMLGAESIVSFDKHFDGLDIQRKEPKDYL